MLYVHNKSFLILTILYLSNFELIIKSTYEHTIMRHTISIYVLIVYIYTCITFLFIRQLKHVMEKLSAKF